MTLWRLNAPCWDHRISPEMKREDSDQILQCQCGSIFAGWDPPRVVKHHYSSFTHLGNSLRIQHQLNRVSLILGGFPHQSISGFWLSWSQWKLPKPITSLPTHSAATPFSNCREPLFVKLRLLLRPLPLVKQRKHEGEVEQCFRDRQSKCTLRSTT